MAVNHAPRARALRRVGSIVLVCAVLLGAWALHGAARAPQPSSAGDAEVPTAAAVAPEPAPTTASGTTVSASTERSVLAAAATPALHPAAEASAPADPRALERAEQARNLLRVLRGRMASGELIAPMGPELAASQLYPYVEGWVDAVLGLDPELAVTLAPDIEALLCDPATTAAKQLVLRHVLELEPSFASERGAACARAPLPDAENARAAVPR